MALKRKIPILFRQSSVLNPFPVPSLQSFASDLTVIEVSGSYYFKAQKGSNLLITGYDFPAGWTKGFPYKSAATIDIFGQTGVPVVSLFQNFDYANQYFTKHVTQVVDGNGVETSQAYVSAIVAYSEALTGDNLTSANTYFDVPTEVTSNVKWIASDGSDSAAGTKDAPWQSFSKIVNDVPTNYTVYIKSGTYTSANILFNANKVISVKAIGLVTKKGSSGNYLIGSQNAYNLTFNRVVFDCTSTIPNALASYTNGAIRFNNCVFKNEATALVVDNSSTIRNTFYDCIFVGRINNSGENVVTYSLVLSNNLFKDCNVRAGTALVQVTNNTFKSSHTSKVCLDISVSGTVLGNYFDYAHSGLKGSAEITAKYNSFLPKTTATAGITTTTATGKFQILDNSFVSNDATISGTPSFIVLTSVNSWDIQRNYFKSTTKQSYTHINILNVSTSVGRTGIINNNYCLSNSISGSIITINSENAASDVNDSCEIKGNRIIGHRFNYPNEATTTTHAMLINGGKNMNILYNYVSHCQIGIVVKNGSSATAYTSGGLTYNLVLDCTDAIWVRGVKGLNIFGCTIKHTGTDYASHLINGVTADENTAIAGDQFCENVIIKNNIIDFPAGTGTHIIFDAHAAANGCIAENNNYSGGQYLLSDGTNYSDLATANASGKLLNCVVGDPLLKASLVPAVALSGADLGADYETGLDTTTTWGSATTIPAITTKVQPATWQKGAYIQ